MTKSISLVSIPIPAQSVASRHLHSLETIQITLPIPHTPHHPGLLLPGVVSTYLLNMVWLEGRVAQFLNLASDPGFFKT